MPLATLPRATAWLAALCVLGACAGPAPRSAGFVEGELSRREAQIQRGLAGARDPAAERDLHALACRLLPSHCADLRLYVVDSERTQARAYGNGMLLVHGALFAQLDDEAELAFALGHELAHLALGHFQAARTPALEPEADAWATRRLASLGYRQDAGSTLLTRLGESGHLQADVAQRRVEALRALE